LDLWSFRSLKRTPPNPLFSCPPPLTNPSTPLMNLDGIISPGTLASFFEKGCLLRISFLRPSPSFTYFITSVVGILENFLFRHKSSCGSGYPNHWHSCWHSCLLPFFCRDFTWSMFPFLAPLLCFPGRGRDSFFGPSTDQVYPDCMSLGLRTKNPPCTTLSFHSSPIYSVTKRRSPSYLFAHPPHRFDASGIRYRRCL